MTSEPQWAEDIEQAAAALFPEGSLNYRRARLILQLHRLEDEATATFEETDDVTFKQVAENSRRWRQRVVAAGLFDED